MAFCDVAFLGNLKSSEWVIPTDALLDTPKSRRYFAPMTKSCAAIILAAGQGKRMRSDLPKVLHPLCEQPLIVHVVRLALAAKCSPVVVVLNTEGERIRSLLDATFEKQSLVFATQEVPRGTGDAARAGLAAIPAFKGNLLVLAGDVPLLENRTIGRLKKQGATKAAVVLTTQVDEPAGYGRIVRDGKAVQRIVEEKDATKEEKLIREINSGVYLFESELLRKAVLELRADNAQGEFYLTDVLEAAAQDNQAGSVMTPDADECQGINNRTQLGYAESVLRKRLIAKWESKGVTFLDSSNAYLGVDVKLAPDVRVGPGVQLWGKTKIGKGAVLHGPCFISDTTVGAGSVIHSFSHLEGARVGLGAQIGPFARLRPLSSLADDVKVGNFVEVKKSKIGKGAKLNHLSYIGDAEVGARSNVGAGTITCNYDGHNKHQTVVGEDVFVGSNATLVAPLELGSGSYVAAGSTVTKTVPSDALAFGRSRQVNREGAGAAIRKRAAKEQAAATKGRS